MILSKEKPLFIVFEGIEGSGKTTQAKMLGQWMAESGFKILETKEPTKELLFGKLAHSLYQAASVEEALKAQFHSLLETPEYLRLKETAHDTKRVHLEHFETIATELLAGNHKDAATLLQTIITLDRHDHLRQVVIPALRNNTYVISDRYFLSTPAYAAANGSDWHRFLTMQFEILGDDFLAPDVVIFLSVPVALGLKRTQEKQRGKNEYFDTTERQKNIERAYKELFSDPTMKEKLKTVIYIDGGATPDLVHEKIVAELEKKLIP